MTNLVSKKIGLTFGDLLTVDATPQNSGINPDLQLIADGNNTKTPLLLSTTKAQIKPSTNASDTFEIQDAVGDTCFKVNTSSKTVHVGENNVHATGRTEVFYWHANYAGLTVNTWYSMFHNMMTAFDAGTAKWLGDNYDTGSDPEASHLMGINTTVEGPAMMLMNWRLYDRISIDDIRILYCGKTTAAGGTQPVFEVQVWNYDSTDLFTGSSGGLIDGTMVADHTGSLTASTGLNNKTLTLAQNDMGGGHESLVPLIRPTTVGTIDLLVKLHVNYHIR